MSEQFNNKRSGVSGAEDGVTGVKEVTEAWNSSRQSSVPGCWGGERVEWGK